MAAQKFLRSCIIITFLLISQWGCSQSSQAKFPFTILKDLSKNEYSVGDTISFVLKNNINKPKDYHVYVSTNDYYNPYYTAYLNNDSAWKKAQMADIERTKTKSNSLSSRINGR